MQTNRLRNSLIAGVVMAGLSFAVVSQAAVLNLNFSSSGGSVLDANGVGTGFTARMDGTGAALPANDTNLVLNTGAGVLQMRSSAGADFNGQAGMAVASVPGVWLSTLGYTGDNDFTATATFTGITNWYLQPDQLCLVVGVSSSDGIRAGFINFSQFYSNNPAGANEGFGVLMSGGSDAYPRFFGTSVGSTMTVEIKRINGVWSVTVNGIDRMPNINIDGTGAPQPPTFLDGQPDLFVGVVASDVFDDSPWHVNLDSFVVSVSGNSPPDVAVQPQKKLVNEGNPVTLSVTATDSTQPPIYYQWYQNNNPVSGATGSAYTFNPSVADAGSYTCVISNSLGKATSSPAPLMVVVPKGSHTANFNAAGGGVTDINGTGIGLPSRLPGTGTSLPANDTNLLLNTTAGTLEITTTSSDFNGGNAMDVNESLGVMLSTLGFTGSQDLNATALFPLPFPETASFDQFGVVVGPSTLAHTRAGCVTFAAKERYSENVNTNEAGVPINGGGQYFGFGFNAGIPMTVLITRINGAWHHYIDGVQWDVITQPTFLNDDTELFAGVFAKDVVNGVHKTISVDSFTARVFDPPTLKVSSDGVNLTFSWNVAGAGLEQNGDVANSMTWTPVEGVTSNPHMIPLPKTGSRYYRIGL